jgi:hypothetical protein
VQLIVTVLNFTVIIFLSVNRYSGECFLWGRVGGTGDEFMEPRGRWPEKVWEPLL